MYGEEREAQQVRTDKVITELMSSKITLPNTDLAQDKCL